MPRLVRALALLALLVPVPASADLGDNDLGLNTHVPADDLLDMSVDAGVSWIRVDANWFQMNPSSGTYDWSFMDRVVASANSRGLRVYMTLAYTPEWVSRPGAGSDGYTGNDVPATSTEWVAFVEAAVGRYSAMGVTHFGIWNEPNLDGFWEGTADQYVDLILIPGADAVRRTCSTCLVLGPDLAHVGDYDVFLDRVLERAMSSFDILAHHTYNGWPENGVEIWDGDRFLEALEMRRFSFTRISLRELLDARGWTGEVWITETGYEAVVGDAADEARQEVYVTRVMEEQLARPWWTNTFFYEITDCGVDQPGCPIDGFGITRPNRAIASGGPRSFPGDYRLKPAYLAIRGFIDDHPEIVAGAPPATAPECANGVDDDGDGRIDGADRGCADGTDDDESDDPPRRTLEALPESGITVDGVLDDWSSAGWVSLAPEDWAGVVPYGGAGDLSVRVAARWDGDDLYFAFEVTDDTHVAAEAAETLYLDDSLQLAFDSATDRTPDAYNDDDHELNFALSGTGPGVVGYRFHGTGTDGWDAAGRRTGSVTTYELRISRGDIQGVGPLTSGVELGFSFLVNDDDGATTGDGTGREGWLQFTPGIGTGKDPYRFGTLALRTTASPDAGVGVDAGAGADAGTLPGADGGSSPGRDGGVAPGIDAGSTTPPDDGGCGCRAAGTGDRGAPLALLGLALLAARRRR